MKEFEKKEKESDQIQSATEATSQEQQSASSGVDELQQ